eukprot:scaffold5650_cov121-Cylindrotheca_fusiformis.AAC.5
MLLSHIYHVASNVENCESTERIKLVSAALWRWTRETVASKYGEVFSFCFCLFMNHGCGIEEEMGMELSSNSESLEVSRPSS